MPAAGRIKKAALAGGFFRLLLDPYAAVSSETADGGLKGSS
jgi:hypothetical protein